MKPSRTGFQPWLVAKKVGYLTLEIGSYPTEDACTVRCSEIVLGYPGDPCGEDTSWERGGFSFEDAFASLDKDWPDLEPVMVKTQCADAVIKALTALAPSRLEWLKIIQLG